MNRKPAIVGIGIMIAGLLMLNQNCSKVGTSECGTASKLLQKYDASPSSHALVYGPGSEDRKFLKDRIKGYTGPGIKEIFERWRRFSKDTIYAGVADVVPDPAQPQCYTGLDAAGNFKPSSVLQNGKSVLINPGTHGDCINLPSLAAVSCRPTV